MTRTSGASDAAVCCVVLGVSLQQARQVLESLDQEALAALGMGSGTGAPPLPVRAVPDKPAPGS